MGTNYFKSDFGKLSSDEQAIVDKIEHDYWQEYLEAAREYDRKKDEIHQAFNREAAIAIMDIRKQKEQR